MREISVKREENGKGVSFFLIGTGKKKRERGVQRFSSVFLLFVFFQLHGLGRFDPENVGGSGGDEPPAFFFFNKLIIST